MPDEKPKNLTPWGEYIWSLTHPPDPLDDPLVIVDGPDYPLSYLLRQAERRERARGGGQGRQESNLAQRLDYAW